jgi:hypothetical protein
MIILAKLRSKLATRRRRVSSREGRSMQHDDTRLSENTGLLRNADMSDLTLGAPGELLDV